MMRSVLVVDDEPDVRLIARVVLQAADFDVIEVASGEAALDHLASAQPPDVVLLDVRMPGIDGWEVLRRLRANPAQAGLPVVIFTADIRAAAEAPVDFDSDRFLAKPFDPEDLVRKVSAAADGEPEEEPDL